MSLIREPGRPRPPLPTAPDTLTDYEGRLRRDARRRIRVIETVRVAALALVVLASIAGFVALTINVHERRVACERRGGLLVPDPDSWLYGMICVRAERIQ